jgi:predicted TIM-barrel fold metal-dependent hydrolase
LDDIVKYDLADYVRNVFLETEVAAAILTSGPGLDDRRVLFNDEMAGVRALFDGLAGSGRLLNQAVVHVDIPEELTAMAEWQQRYNPVAWKVYTMGRPGGDGLIGGWMLDDHTHGFPFLERVRKYGPKRISVHKGISLLVDNGSPRDVGPAAKAFPDIQFLIYHSGYEFDTGPHDEEGPYTPETVGRGVNRFIHSCMQNGIGAGGNVYAELGTTWFALIRRPRAAAHVLGKLIKHFGEDNVVWGSDSIFYGSQQPLIDAFRAFQIPDAMCEEFGYAKLTKEVKDKILGRNGARVYNLDLDTIKARAASDDLHWCKLMIEDYQKHGFSIAQMR